MTLQCSFNGTLLFFVKKFFIKTLKYLYIDYTNIITDKIIMKLNSKNFEIRKNY